VMPASIMNFRGWSYSSERSSERVHAPAQCTSYAPCVRGR
jgi:hypothetical protein